MNNILKLAIEFEKRAKLTNKLSQVMELGTSNYSTTREEDVRLAKDVNLTIATSHLFDEQNIYDVDYLGEAMIKIIKNNNKCLSREEYSDALAMLRLQNYFNAFTTQELKEIKFMLGKYTV